MSSTLSSREMIHNFSAVASRVAAGEEITVTRHGKPLLRLMPVGHGGMGVPQRDELVARALAVRMTAPLGKQPFKRSDAYDN